MKNLSLEGTGRSSALMPRCLNGQPIVVGCTITTVIGNTKPYLRFHRFCYKTYYQICSHTFLLFSYSYNWQILYYIFMISNRKSWKFQSFKNCKFQESMIFTLIMIDGINWLKFDLEHIFSPKCLPGIPLKVTRRHTWKSPQMFTPIKCPRYFEN